MALLALIPAARSETASCRGRDLIEALQTDDFASYDRIQSEADRVTNGEAVLWRIEGPNGTESFLFGTVHVSDPRITEISAEARAAFDSADTVALELAEIAEREQLATAMMRHARYMAMPVGQSLWDIVPDGEEAPVRQNPNLPEGRAAVLDAYQPWVVAMMLAIPLCEQVRTEAGALALDEILARRAVAQGKKLVGLEKVEDQLAIFSSMPLSLQVDYLIATAKLGHQIEDYFETLISQYLRRRLTTLLPLSRHMERSTGGDGMAAAFIEERLITERNLNMHAAALELLKRGRVFIAVGALHLPGEKGLVQLIRDSGLQITPVE